ncbi:MAG: hypothetical protein GFH24_608434n42 [Chloroflexi bacterium AL-N5]|nr:hypothetical protein [Chloroflexi bacterium AL-N5]
MLTFLILALVMIVGSVGVISLKQPVHAALALVGTLLTLAVTYVTLEAHFLAAIQVIVYAGAIMVLFLFVIMLLNVEGNYSPSRIAWLRPVAYGVGLLAAAGLLLSVFLNPAQAPDLQLASSILKGGGAEQIAEALFSEFVLAFQLVGILLLTGIIGATSLVQRKAVQVRELEPAPVEAVAAAPVSRTSVATLERPSPADIKPDAVKPDDLKRIKGIGPKLEKLLHQNGIFTFETIAALTPSEVTVLDEQLEEFKGRIVRDDWQAQARQLAEEKRRSR